MNKAINLRNNPGQGLISCIFPLSLALLIALPGIASAQSTAGAPVGSSADEPATAASTSTEVRTDTARAKQGLTGSPKRTTAADTGTPPPADMRGWVPRIDYKHCPNGTTSFVASDGGVKCWAGPVN